MAVKLRWAGAGLGSGTTACSLLQVVLLGLGSKETSRRARLTGCVSPGLSLVLTPSPSPGLRPPRLVVTTGAPSSRLSACPGALATDGHRLGEGLEQQEFILALESRV